ncbi:MAG: hypothetical protein Q9221_003286 [Calogaya cf. arnoldii]
MSADQNIILFDIPSKGHCASWSPNTWKSSNRPSPLPFYRTRLYVLTTLLPSFPARLLLNYKQIPYTTQWTELSKIDPHLRSLGIPPNPPSPYSPPYTLPTIRFPEGSYVMDSKNIAASLEEKYPSPPLHLDSPQVAKIEALLPQLLVPMRGILIPKIGRTLLNQESVPYFHETRSKMFGMPLDQMDRELGGDAQWEEAKPVIREFAALLEENGGPFVFGAEVSYADFILVGAMCLFKKLGEGVFKKLVEMEPAFGDLYRASEKWLEKDD